MSRCFPYPPPGYRKNAVTDEALIESIKLRKETEKSKAEKKKVKRSKKDKEEKRKDKEKSKENQKLSKSLVDSKEVNNKLREPSTERLDKSDISEEHGQPIVSHNRSHSSDSTQNTQNSNKRKRDDAATSPSDTSSHGKTIRIRLVKKHEESDLDSGRTDLTHTSAEPRKKTCLISERTDLSAPKVHGLHLKETTSFQSSGRTSLSAPSRTENSAGKGLPLDQKKSTPSSTRPGKTSDLSPPIKKPTPSFARTENISHLPPPSGTTNNGVQRLLSSQKKSTPSFSRPEKTFDLPAPSGTTNSGRPGDLSAPPAIKNSGVLGLHFSEKQSKKTSDLLSPSGTTATKGIPLNQKQSTPSFVRPGKTRDLSALSAMKNSHVQGIPSSEKKSTLGSGKTSDLSAPSGTTNGEVRGPLLSEKKSTPDFARPQKLNDLPAPSTIKNNGVQCLHLSEKQLNQSSERPSQPAIQLLTSTTKKTEAGVKRSRNENNKGKGVRLTRSEKKAKKKHKKYEKLIRNWVPEKLEALLSSGNDDEDEDWLFKKKDANSVRKNDESCRGDVEMSCRESSLLWQPRAQLLPEADIYALPFTVPF